MDCAKVLVVFLVVALATSSFAIIGSVSAQTIKPVVTDFWLQYVDNSYDVPPSTKSTKDIYTGEVTTSTVPGYRVENTSIVVTIKNPPDVDAYNFRWKDHNSDVWRYEPFDPDQPLPLRVYDGIGIRANASSSEYTVLSLIFIPKTLASVDVQVQALYGDYRAIPYGSALGYPTYDFYFDGQASHWSHIQTIDLSAYATTQPSVSQTPSTPTETASSEPTTTPTQPDTQTSILPQLSWEQTAILVLVGVVGALLAGLVVLWRKVTHISAANRQSEPPPLT